MKKLMTVVELSTFSNKVDKLLTEAEKNDIISYLSAHPEEGDKIPGAGGLRKIRFQSHNKGKRGGYRVIYYFYNETMPLFLFEIYSKSEREDLDAEQKKDLTKLARMLKNEFKNTTRQ